MTQSKLSPEQEFYLPARIEETSSILNLENAQVMPYNDRAVIVDLPTGPKIVNFCSKVYGLVENDKIFPEIEKLLSEKYIFKKSYRHVNHCVFWADYELEGRDMFIGNIGFEDSVKPLIRIMHSYNGSVKYRAIMGFRRQICSNGLWGYVFDTQFELRHSVGNLHKIFENTLKGVEKFLEQAEDFKLKYEDMTSKAVANPQEKIELIINSSNFPKRQADAVLQRLEYEANNLNLPVNDWLIYNAFNYQINHNEEFSNDESYRMKMDHQILRLINEGVRELDKLVLV
ncbi:MAG TPA: DUF932 domain-containing protein [Bacteroidales bacterium]|nr:DUF932 domain-containing protein [Bacteroidales bacterium]